MEKIEPYNRILEHNIAEHVAAAIATRRGANQDAHGYVPNPTFRSGQINASAESVQDALFIINGSDIRTRVSRLVELKDEQFFSDVTRYLQNFR